MVTHPSFILVLTPTLLLQLAHYEAVLSYIRQSNRSLQHHELLLAISVTEQELRNILADLEEQHFITYHAQEQTYTSTRRPGKIDFVGFEVVRSHRQQELAQMQRYATGQECYMNYLTAQLGEQEQYACGHCGYCQQEHFPYILPSERIQTAVLYFLHEDFMPCIERYHFGQFTVHERGWSLSYHGKTNIGKQVRASKYEDVGPFALSLVTRTVEVIRARYPLASMQGIVSVPPTKSGALVETFARQVAEASGIAYLTSISGNACGVDSAALEGTMNAHGSIVLVLPHGIRKLHKVERRKLQAGIENGHILLISQFHPDAPWLISRAMERNKVVTGLAQAVIVAESGIQGGTWEGANGALKQGRRLYVRQTDAADSLPGNTLLLEKGGLPLTWPTQDIATTLLPLLEESHR